MEYKSMHGTHSIRRTTHRVYLLFACSVIEFLSLLRIKKMDHTVGVLSALTQ